MNILRGSCRELSGRVAPSESLRSKPLDQVTRLTPTIKPARIWFATAAALLAFVVAPAWSSTGTATLTAGSLAFIAPQTVAFSATLTGLDQTATAAQAIDVADATGSGTGWKLQATSTPFCTSGNVHCLANAATTVQSPGPAVACDALSSCTTATHGAGLYPYTLPAATVAPTATTFFNATVGTGLGKQTVTATFTVAIPANTYAGTYNSIWTYSLASAP